MIVLGLRERKELAKNMQMTVLYRPKGVWRDEEFGALVKKFQTEASRHPRHPEHIILLGHYDTGVIIRVLAGGSVPNVLHITGMGSEALPFVPPFL